MTQVPKVSSDFRPNPRLTAGSAVLGMACGTFVGGYWLADVLPASSRLLLLLTGLASVAGAVGFYYMLNWARIPYAHMPLRERAAVAGFSLVAGIALFFGGTSQWRAPARYVSFLLPAHQLQVSVVSGDAPGAPVAIEWFNTSLGDVSYDSMELRGWNRQGDQLVLTDPVHNSLQWSGRTGETVQLVFRRSSATDKIVVAWDSQQETLGAASGKFTYLHTFQVPWYASKTFLLALGILVFVCMALVLSVAVLEQRKSLVGDFEDAFAQGIRLLERRDWAIILAVIVLGLLLRLPNLGTLFPAVDEYYHLIAARQIAEGAALSAVYPRGLWLVTLPVMVSLRVFGYQLWAARLVGAVLNVLAIVPLYLLAGKVNRPVAVIAAVLYATSPWIVTFARIAREYAYYPFYFYWIIYGLVVFLEGIPEGFILLRAWRALIHPKMLLLGLALIIPPVFAYYGDLDSTFRTIWIAYLVFAVFLLARFNWRDRMNLPVLGLLTVGLLMVVRGWYEDQKAKVSILPSFNPVPVEYFLPNPPQQWYFDRLAVVIVTGMIGLVVLSLALRRRNFIPVFILTLFATYLAIFALFATTFYHTRHLSSTELWFILAVAMCLYVVWRALTRLLSWKGPWVQLLVAVALALAVVNPRQILVPITSLDPDNPISEDYLHDLSPVHAFMLAHVQPGDVLVSTVYGLYSSWEEAPRFEAQYRITSQTPREEIYSLIDAHASGWLVIDQIRLQLSGLKTQEFAGKGDVEYIGMFGDEHVWHWQH